MNIVSISQKIMKLGFIIALAGQLILATRTAPVAGALGETAEAATNTTPEPSDFCDLEKLAASETLFLQLTQQEQESPGSVSQEELQQAALQFTLESEKCYQAQQVQDEPVYIDEEGLWVPGYMVPDYLLNGRKWGTGSPFETGNPPGLAGGTVTFSFMSDGVDLTAETASLSNVAITSLPTYQACFMDEIRNAFAAWSAIANIQFVEVPDNGQPFNNANAVGDIRIGAHTFDGASNLLAHAYYPPPNGTSGAGDMHFDAQENWTCDTSGIDIGIVAIHELGHSIGLGHEPSITAIMNPIYNPSLGVLQPDDVNGAKAIYGINSTNLPTLHCGTLNSDETWISDQNVHVVDCNVIVPPGITLTIGQGAIVKFQLGTSLIVQGTLQVLGAAGNPAYFTSIRDDTVGGDTNNDSSATVPAPGNWWRIELGENSNDGSSLIDHAEIRYGGGTNTAPAPDIHFGTITLLSACPTIQNSIIRDSLNYAYRADPGSCPTLTNNTLINNGINGLALTNDVYGNTLDVNAAWNVTGTTYYLRDTFTIGTDKTLVIAPGVIVKFMLSQSLLVTGNNSTLQVNGTDGSPVIFTSIRDDTVGGDTNNDSSATVPAPGNWWRIELGENSNDGSSLIDHAEIRYGGGTNTAPAPDVYFGAITLLKSGPTIQNSTIRDSLNYGISANNSTVILGCNNIFDNGTLNSGKRYYGMYNQTPNVIVNAINQWWGGSSGPYHPTLNPTGTGNAVTDGVDFIPWRTSPCGTYILTVTAHDFFEKQVLKMAWQPNRSSRSLRNCRETN